MEDRLKRIAIKLSDWFVYFETPHSVYTHFRDLFKKQPDYFGNFSASDIIKLVFYIFSYKNTGNFKVSDQLLNNLGFAHLFYPTGNYYVEKCESCGGDGGYDCDDCDGRGKFNCQTCDGTGEIDCGICDGTGEDEQGNTCETCSGYGHGDCNVCNGSGEYECDTCGGEGGIHCSQCDGNGDVETSEWEYDSYTICTWKSEIKNLCELKANTQDPVMSEYEFDKISDDYILLHGLTDEHAEFKNFVQEREVYCSEYLDEPQLYLSKHIFYIEMFDDNMNNYIV